MLSIPHNSLWVKNKVILNGYEKMRLLSCGVNNNFRGFPAKMLTQYVVVFK
jgi:hypothetical protein